MELKINEYSEHRKIRKDINNIVGGKASKLCELKSIHMNVPDGIIISFEAYQEYIKANNILDKIEFCVQKIETGELEVSNASQLIQDYFMKGVFSDKLKKKYRIFLVN